MLSVNNNVFRSEEAPENNKPYKNSATVTMMTNTTLSHVYNCGVYFSARRGSVWAWLRATTTWTMKMTRKECVCFLTFWQSNIPNMSLLGDMFGITLSWFPPYNNSFHWQGHCVNPLVLGDHYSLKGLNRPNIHDTPPDLSPHKGKKYLP